MAAVAFHITSGLVFDVVTLLRSLNSIYRQTFIDISQFTADITTSGLEKQTSAILEFFFRLLFRPYHDNRRVIPHQTIKFRPNLTLWPGKL